MAFLMMFIAVLSIIAGLSNAHENVIYAEATLLNAAKAYVIGEEANLEMIKRKVEKIERMNKEAVRDPAHYLGHPVNDFLLVKRFIYEWKEIENMVSQDNSKSAYLANVNQYRTSMPKINDMNGAAVALLRLQHSYRLSATNIANGAIPGTWITSVLSAHDCFQLGRIAYESKDFYHATLWLQEALARLPDPLESIDHATISNYLSWSMNAGNTNTLKAQGVNVPGY